MRNKFAHNYSRIDFNTPDIVELCDKLASPSFFLDKMLDKADRKEFQKICDSPRSKFALAVTLILDAVTNTE
jgi:hypothetical protein